MRGRRIYGGPGHVNKPSQTIQIESEWKIKKSNVSGLQRLSLRHVKAHARVQRCCGTLAFSLCSFVPL